MKSSTGLKFISWLGHGKCRDCGVMGGKAANLCHLAGHYRVPPGFCLTAEAADMARAGCPPPGWSETPPALPAVLVAELAAAYQELAAVTGMDAPRVAVRSSALDEDGAVASFAGQHETYLNITGVAALAEAVARCWSSVSSPRAREYRRLHDLATEGRIAVLVQQLVPADVSAVIFSANPVTGDRGDVVINASWGLGESVVGGTVTPDTYVVRKADMTVISRRVADKRHMTVLTPDGTREVDVPRFLRAQPALKGEQAVEMARLGTALERGMGHPVDVECAYAAGQLFLLQCRPITTLPALAGGQAPVRP